MNFFQTIAQNAVKEDQAKGVAVPQFILAQANMNQPDLAGVPVTGASVNAALGSNAQTLQTLNQTLAPAAVLPAETGLSSGAKIGIGLGAIALVFGIILIARH